MVRHFTSWPNLLERNLQITFFRPYLLTNFSYWSFSSKSFDRTFGSKCFWPSLLDRNLHITSFDHISWPIFLTDPFRPNLLIEALDQSFWTKSFDQLIFLTQFFDQRFWTKSFDQFFYLAHPVFNRIFSTKSSWPSRLIKSNQMCFAKSNMLLKFQTNSSTNITSANTYFTFLHKNKLHYLLYTSFWKIIDFHLFHTSQ